MVDGKEAWYLATRHAMLHTMPGIPVCPCQWQIDMLHTITGILVHPWEMLMVILYHLERSVKHHLELM